MNKENKASVARLCDELSKDANYSLELMKANPSDPVSIATAIGSSVIAIDALAKLLKTIVQEEL